MGKKFRISEKDYVNAMWLATRPTKRRWAYYAALLAVIAAAVAFWDTNYLFLGGVIALVYVLQYGVAPFIWRRHYRKSKTFDEEIEAELTGEGVRMRSVTSDVLVPWHHILKWRHNRHTLLVYSMPRLAHIIPKSADAAGLDITALMAELRQRVGSPEIGA
jgi:hypothetical protein